VGRAKHMRIMPGGALEADQELGGPSSIFVGRKLDDHRGAFFLEHPMDKGVVTENGWDAMERLWEVRTTWFVGHEICVYRQFTRVTTGAVFHLFKLLYSRIF
jgi:hypothetical protein